ncbi:MAG: endonuclease/exonuclease/phosphatase family protein [Tropicimonas sp.]|uniref:endonuclease/exonuclease/phosphatase family protein n=1 Tax=Tropicimonas sp. TaxID=2067044 RepID=UPI003A8BA024
MSISGLRIPAIRPGLTPVSLAEREALLAGAQDGLSHEAAWQRVAALEEVELAGHDAAEGAAPERIRVGAWNVQQCHFPEPGAALLASRKFDLVLLSEVDIGMRRTGQANTPGLLAAGQGHGYGFAVEFLELRSPDGIVPGTTGGAPNVQGFHGNGFTSRQRPTDLALIRLAPEADWFVKPRRDQARVGGRVAIAGRFRLGTGSFIAVSVHLESDTDGEGRGRQMAQLLDCIDRFAPGEPVLIGGDFNAGARHPTFDASSEALFGVAAAAGYDWRGCNLDRPTSRRSRVTNAVQQSAAHYDWFFTRGLRASAPQVIAAVDGEGGALSDHELIAVTVEQAG